MKSQSYILVPVLRTQIQMRVQKVLMIKKKAEITVACLNKRPDLKELVRSEIKLSELENNNITFYSCGPATFNDDFRNAVVQGIDSSLKIDVELEEESFTW